LRPVEITGVPINQLALCAIGRSFSDDDEELLDSYDGFCWDDTEDDDESYYPADFDSAFEYDRSDDLESLRILMSSSKRESAYHKN
jgi:hypothetical protein